MRLRANPPATNPAVVVSTGCSGAAGEPSAVDIPPSPLTYSDEPR
jgi:hypothetical protein